VSNNTAKKTGVPSVRCKPFLKWAGGKSYLLPELICRLPGEFNCYFEPFAGGSALFFAMQPQRALLSDINPELINVYQVVRTDVESLIKDLSSHVYEKDYYYTVRSVDRRSDFKQWSNVKKASRLIFLNKTCFNGLYRVNSRGEFNVPFGRYTNPTICDADNLRACSKALQNTKITMQPFIDTPKKAKRGDFIYFDPPYLPLTDTSNFTGYAKNGFAPEMQVRLRDMCLELNKKGVNFMLSNSSAAQVLELYKDFNMEFVKAPRFINSKGNKRGEIEEVIVRNYG